jgi:uncharacterized protein (UPF0332 family)
LNSSINYDEILNKGQIKKFKSSKPQAEKRLELARRNIQAARAMLANDRDWAFSIAYNAILQTMRALMFAKGFRPGGGEGQQKVAERFAELTTLGFSIV